LGARDFYDCEQFDVAIGFDLILVLFFLAFLASWRLFSGFEEG
jgi:hypothetical protein